MIYVLHVRNCPFVNIKNEYIIVGTIGKKIGKYKKRRKNLSLHTKILTKILLPPLENLDCFYRNQDPVKGIILVQIAVCGDG